MAHIRLGELLIDAGVLREEQLKEALTPSERNQKADWVIFCWKAR